jgi:aminoglycoside 6-adenylyltransferase
LGMISIDATDLFDAEGEPTITLLDKDGLLPVYPFPNDEVFWVRKPNHNQYYACCNEFWWCLNNVVKGIARDELPYAMQMLNSIVRNMLNKMVEWYIGVNTGFSVSAGKFSKYFKKYLPPELYAQYTATYSGSNYTDIWAAVDTMCNLFHTLTLKVATHFDFTYRQEEEAGMREYLRMVKEHVL